MDPNDISPGGSSADKEPTCNAGETLVNSWVREIKESTCNMGNLGLIPGLERSPGGGHGNPFLYSCLKNSQGQRNQRSTVDGVAKSQTSERLSTEQYNIES